MIIDINLALSDKAYLSKKRCLIRPNYLVSIGVEFFLIRLSCLVGVNETLPKKV